MNSEKNLLNCYLVNVNTYTRFKKRRVRKLLERYVKILIFVSFLLILLKMLIEWKIYK